MLPARYDDDDDIYIYIYIYIIIYIYIYIIIFLVHANLYEESNKIIGKKKWGNYSKTIK